MNKFQKLMYEDKVRNILERKYGYIPRVGKESLLIAKGVIEIKDGIYVYTNNGKPYKWNPISELIAARKLFQIDDKGNYLLIDYKTRKHKPFEHGLDVNTRKPIPELPGWTETEDGRLYRI